MILYNFEECLNDETIYKPDQIVDVIKQVRANFRFNQINTKHKYFNVPCALDLETSSFYDSNMEKVGLMYVWILGIYGKIIIGRTWEELTVMLEKLVEILDLNENKRVICYVHNLQFDFQFFRSHFTFTKVFASDRRQPLYALTDSGIEFRCSYMLSGLSLAKVGDNLLKYKVNKKVGDLDYSLIRHSKTRLTKKELGYCSADVKVVMAYIAEEIERYNGLARLPLTKTGYVRNYCRNFLFRDLETGKKDKHKFLQNKDLMDRLEIIDADMYTDLKNAFAGGFTHGNSLYIGKTLRNVSSWDFTSSYPTVMIAERFPMGRPERIDCVNMEEEEFLHNINLYCCIFTICLHGLQEKPDAPDNYISQSKCIKLSSDAVINNGRVVSASYCELTITNIDYEIMTWLYEWDTYDVCNLIRWQRGYLPRDFVLAILELYKNKTELKGVAGKEAEYMVSKGMLNACYGMAVTDIVREVNEYTDRWELPYLPLIDNEIKKYNRKRGRFLYYPWGLFTVAAARKNLFSGIIEAGINDYVYSDTDSIKLLNTEKHINYFQQYNEEIIDKLTYALEYHDIDPDYIRPKTIKGIEKPLGVWDYEGTFDRFKALGAKRYLLEKDGKLELTVSGLNKKIVVPYLLDKYGTNDAVFSAFKDGLSIPEGFTGKMTHTYIDEPKKGLVTDYKGNTIEYEEPTAVHLENSGYELSMSAQFVQFLLNHVKGI